MRPSRMKVVALFSLVVVALGACSERVVYRDRSGIDQPPEGAANFLGYSDVSSHRTVCGTCHAAKQAEWEKTAHATAWQTVTSSSHFSKACEGCHTVNARGNAVTDTNVAWTATRNMRYTDVQCESCHGPGLNHALEGQNGPLASLRADTGLTNGCGECHSGLHTPFVEEWRESNHSRFSASRTTDTACVRCHEPRQVLKRWGINTVMVEDTTAPIGMVTCATCHDPHSDANPAQLRFGITSRDLSQNLCMKCHQRRANPDQSSTRGPHSPQGPTLIGTAGWFPPSSGITPGTIYGTHGSDRNENKCVTCHYRPFTVNNANGSLRYANVGHTFDPTPCVDVDGIPTDSTTCPDSTRSYKACVSCHLTEQAARTAQGTARARLLYLAATVDGLVARIPSTEFKTNDNLITTGEGAKFNSALAKMPGAQVHNPFLVEQLLIASIHQIELDYGLRPAIMAQQLQPQLLPR